MARIGAPELRRAGLLTLAVALAGGGTVGCAAKVRQDVFDQTIADLRSDIDGIEARTEENASRIDEHDARLAELRSDLEVLAAELGELETAITELEDGIRFATPVHFEFDRADIRAEDRPILDRFARVVEGYYPAAMITVEGFADPSGSAAYNLDLSMRRADAVSDYLTAQAGLDPAGIRTAAYGEDRQVVPGAQGPGRAGLENRRVAFVIELAGPLRTETVAAREGNGG